MIKGFSVRDICPATLSTLPFTDAQLEALTALGNADRLHELGRMIYAHLYRQTCRAQFVVILSHHGDLALQAYWQERREDFIARALSDYERAVPNATTALAA